MLKSHGGIIKLKKVLLKVLKLKRVCMTNCGRTVTQQHLTGSVVHEGVCSPPSPVLLLRRTRLKCLRLTSQRVGAVCRGRFLPQTRVSRRHRMSGPRWLLERVEERLQTREIQRSSNHPATRRNTGERESDLALMSDFKQDFVTLT